MPKIIENLREDILATTEEIIKNEGLDSLSIRSIAGRLSIAPATIYNYFSSRERIVGEIITARWKEMIKDLDETIGDGGEKLDLFSTIVERMSMFIGAFFNDWFRSADKTLNTSEMGHVHQMKSLIFEQIMQRVEIILARDGMNEEKAKEISPELTRLIIMCSHDRTMDFKKIAAALAAINKGD